MHAQLAVAFASIIAFAALAGVAGCDAGPPATAAGPAAPAAHPFAGLDPLDARIGGTVAEVLPTGGYTYFRLAGPRPAWAVVMGPGPAVGERVEARVFARKADFRSRRLDRTFASLSFVTLDRPGG